MEELMNLDNLSEAEKKQILLVIKRDEELKKAQDTRMGQLKAELHNLRMQSVLREGDDLSKICARCHKPFGFFFNTGDVCSQCKFRVCSSCRESLLSGKWLCVLCYKQLQLKGISGDWIYSNTDNENHRKSFSGTELVKKSLRKSLSANGRVADDYSDPGAERLTKQKDYGTESQSGRDFVHSTSDEYSKDFQQAQNTGNLTTKSREAEGSDGGPDSKRGLAKHNSASHEELDRVGYPKDSDKKRLSSLFDSFKSSKDESEEPIQVRHVSCRRRRDSDSESDSGSSIEGESPMEVGDSKTHSSDHLSSAQSASLAQNLSETESTSDMLREKRLSAEISEDVQVPSEEHDQNGGQSSEEMSRQSPEVIPMMPTETVITVKRRSGEPEYLPTLEESVECPVSTARNSSQVSEPRSNIVRRTSSEKSDSSMSSARTASPATKMRLLDLASKRALERESFDQEESGNESPKHKDDSLSNGLSQAKRTPINGPSARHGMGEGFGVFKAVEQSLYTLGEGRHTALAAESLGPSSDPLAQQSVHAHRYAFRSLDTEQGEITPNETFYTERGNLGFGDDNMPAFSVTDNYKKYNTSWDVMHDTSQHENASLTNTGGGCLLHLQSDDEPYGDDSIESKVVENQFVSSDSPGPDHCQTSNAVSVTVPAVTAATAAAVVSSNLVPCSQVQSIPTVTGFQSSPVVSSSNSEVNVAFSTPEPNYTQIAFNVSPHVEKTSECSKIAQTNESHIKGGSDLEQNNTIERNSDVTDCQTQNLDYIIAFDPLAIPKASEKEISKDVTEISFPPTYETEFLKLHSQGHDTEIGFDQTEPVNLLAQASKTTSVNSLMEPLRPLSQDSRSGLVSPQAQDTEGESAKFQSVTESGQPLSPSYETSYLRHSVSGRPLSQGRATISVRPLSQGSETGSVIPLSQGSETISVRPLSQGSETISVRPLSQGSETISVRPLSQGSETGSVRPVSQGSETGSVRPLSQGSETISVRPLSQSSETISVRPLSEGSVTGSVRPLSEGRETGSVRPFSQGSETGSVRPFSQGSETGSVRPLSQGSETGSARPLSQSSGTGSFSSGFDVDIGVSELVLRDVNPRLAMMVHREELLFCSESSLEEELSPEEEKNNERGVEHVESLLFDPSVEQMVDQDEHDETRADIESDPFGDESTLDDLSECVILQRCVQEVLGSEKAETAKDLSFDSSSNKSPLIDLSDNEDLEKNHQEVIDPKKIEQETSIVSDAFADKTPVVDFSVHKSLHGKLQMVVADVHQTCGTFDVPISDLLCYQDVKKGELDQNVQLIDLTDSSKEKNLPDESVSSEDLMLSEVLDILSLRKETRQSGTDAQPVANNASLNNDDICSISKSSEEVGGPLGGSPQHEQMLLDFGNEKCKVVSQSEHRVPEFEKQDFSLLLQNMDSKTSDNKDEVLVKIEAKDQDKTPTRNETGNSRIQGLLEFWKEKQAPVSDVESRKKSKDHDVESRQQNCSKQFEAPIILEAQTPLSTDDSANEFEVATMDDIRFTDKVDSFTYNEQVIAKDASQTIAKDSCFSTSSTSTASSSAQPDSFSHLASVSGNSDSDVTISDLTNSSKYSNASDPSIAPLSSDTESSVLAVDSNPQYACTSSDYVTSAREVEINKSNDTLHVMPDSLTSARKLEVEVIPDGDSLHVTPDNKTSARQIEIDIIQPRDSSQVTSDLTSEKSRVAPVRKEIDRVAIEPAENVPTEPASASANSPQPETCSESEVEDFEVAEFPLYASPEEVQELQSSADEAVDTVLEVKLQQIRDLPIQAEDWEIPVENKDNVNSHQTQKLAYRRANTSLHQTPEKVSQQTKDSADRYIKNRVHLKNDNENSKFVQGAHAAPILQKERGKNHNRHEEADFENEDILETKSEPSTVYHDLMDDAPERTSTPKNKIETIDDDTLFKLLSSVPLSSNTSESLEPPKRRGSKDDSDIQLRSTSQSSTTAASSAATMINLSQIGMPVDNGEGDPFATESADVREAMQRYLEQEEEMSDCLSVITERTEPEDDDYDDVSEISKGLDETVEDEELDKEIEKIYQANLHIDSYLSSESFRSGTVSSAIRKSRKGLQKKHIEEVLSSPISHDLPAISESEPESTDTEDKAMREGKEVETHDKFSTVSDTISAYLSDMSSVDNSNIQTPASSEPVSDEDDKSEQAATASDEQDSAWFDMSMSVDSVKEVLTVRGSGLQKEELKASLSSETLCDEDLPRDDEEEVDTNTNRNRESQADENKNDGNVADSQAEEEMSTNQIVKSQFDNQNGNDVEEQNVYIGNVKEQNFALESENASTPFPLPMHVADDVTSTSDKILSSSLVTSLPDLDSQAQSTTLTSTFAASPAESSSDIRPQVKVTGDGMSDETGSHGGDSGHISGNSAENTPEHRGSRSPRHSHLSIPSLALTSTSAEEASQEEDEDIDEMVATHKSVGSLRGSYGNLTSSLADSRESLYSVYSDAGEINYGKIPVTGEILFGLDYNYKTGALEIFIKQCRDIAPVDTKHNKSDPYVKTYLLPDRTRSGKRKTKIKKHTLNPTFDEVLKYVISKSEVENRALWVTVWNHDRFGRNDFLGEVMIGLDCYKFGDSTPIWYPLQERLEAPGSAPVSYKGDLVLSVKYVTAENIESKETTKKGKSKKVKGTSRGELQVLIKEARNLTAVRSNGASDPFCKAYLLPEKHKSSKQKTPVIKRNCNPTWNHVFLFEDIEITELKDRSLELTVWDYDKITSNDFLGGIRLNLGTGVAGGRNAEWMDGRGEEIALWQSVMDRPNCWNDATIGLRASMGKSEIRK